MEQRISCQERDGVSRPQVRKVDRRTVMTPEKQDQFLAELAASCNVTRSAMAIDVLPDTVRKLHDRDAEFRARWELALAQGYVTLELKLLERAIYGGEPVGEGATAPRLLDDRHAISLLNAHRKTVAEVRARLEAEGNGPVGDPVGELIGRIKEMARRRAKPAKKRG